MSLPTNILMWLDKSYVSIARIHSCQTGLLYHVIIQKPTQLTQTYLVGVWGSKTVCTLYSHMTAVQRDSANFRCNDNGIVTVGRDVPTVSAQLDSTNEITLEIAEYEKTIWSLMNLLQRYNARIEVASNCYAKVSDCVFSMSTPTITVGAFTPDGYRVRTLWSYEPLDDKDCVSVLLGAAQLSELKQSVFADYICDYKASGESEVYLVNLAMRRLPAAYANEVDTALTFSLGYMLYSIEQYDLYSAVLDGLNCAYRYMRYKNGIRFSKAVSQGYTPKRDYIQNIKIIRELARPNLTRVNRLLYDQSTKLAALLDSTPADQLDSFFQRHFFPNSSEPFAKMFMLGFKLVYDKNNFIKDLEYQQYSSQIKSLLFKNGLAFFKLKINLLDSNIDYCLNTPYPTAGGMVMLQADTQPWRGE